MSLVGFGYKRVTKVAVDNHGRMIASDLPDVDKNTIVCLQAGKVNTRSFDPAEEIISIVKKKGAWVHVDGAFGLWAGASKSMYILYVDLKIPGQQMLING